MTIKTQHRTASNCKFWREHILNHQTEFLKASHLLTGRTWSLCPHYQKTSPPVHFLISLHSAWLKSRTDTATPAPSGSHAWPNPPPEPERKQDRKMSGCQWHQGQILHEYIVFKTDWILNDGKAPTIHMTYAHIRIPIPLAYKCFFTKITCVFYIQYWKIYTNSSVHSDIHVKYSEGTVFNIHRINCFLPEKSLSKTISIEVQLCHWSNRN